MTRTFKYIFRMLFFILIAAIASEFLLGIAFSYKDRHIEPLPVKDYPYLYFLFRAGNGLNQYGLKTNYPVKKEKGIYRIIFTGGSVARGNRPEETIAAYLEKEFRTEFNTENVEVINAGISAFVVEQEFILIQLILQNYNPDLIVSLDGYNDLMSYKFNRRYDTDFPLPPHNWEDFQVIKDNRFKTKFYSRFAYFFKNINRVKEYYKRATFERKFDWNNVEEKELQQVSKAYWKVVDDTRDFCQAKNISYFSFLQPVKYYSKKQNGEKLPPAKETLARLYKNFEKEITKHDYAYSLTASLEKHLDWFTDECHVNSDGNRLLAHDIFATVKDTVAEKLTHQGVSP